MATTTRLLPWVRTGLPTALSTADPLSGGTSTRAQVDVRVSINGTYADHIAVALLGPGDVTALGAGQVLRSDPAPGAFDVEPNYFTTVDLASAALPWLFTPYAPSGDALRPWLVLVVVSTAEAELSPATDDRPAILRTSTNHLPDLAQSHLWAHAEITESDAPGAPTRAISRLICPRLLSPDTDYVAAVVPAFESGRRAGLGQDPDVPGPAWDVQSSAAVELPVYYSWTFRTGPGGDFEQLASRLRRVPSSTLSAGITAAVPTTLPGDAVGSGWECTFPGALGGTTAATPPSRFVTRLTSLVNGTRAAGLPVAPTFYGRWLAATSRLSATGGPLWLRQLNRNPQYRAAAALGTRFVQDNQEELMAAAWRQIGEVERANALITAGQVARASSHVLHQRISSLDPATLLQVAGPLLSRVLVDTAAPARTIRSAVLASAVPAALVSPAVRRVLRPRGPLSRRTGVRASDLLAAVNAGTAIVRPRTGIDGTLTVTPAQVDAERVGGAAIGWVKRGPRAQQKMRAAVIEALGPLLGSLAPDPQQPRPPALDLQGLAAAISSATDPAVTVPRRVASRVQGPPGWAPDDPLTPILAAPRIDTALSRHLIATAPRWLLPGLADLPDDSATAIPTNKPFVEALLVGANHEFGRELGWRGYPTDQRGTAFHRFWDRAGSPAGPTDDIDDIATWSGALGSHLASGSDEFVLVVRGQLLRRYPTTLVYASRAEWDTSGPTPIRRLASTPQEVFATFTGTIDPDITFSGFELPTPALGGAPSSGDAGWFFVFLQAPVTTRFGLDAPADPGTAATGTGWDALDWGRVETTASGHFRIGSTPPAGIPAAEWAGLTSASLAVGCRQRRFRACIHATDLVLP